MIRIVTPSEKAEKAALKRVAKQLIKQGDSINKVVEATGLTLDVVQRIAERCKVAA
jgi:hypothetical protein